MTCSVTPLTQTQVQQLAYNAGFSSTLAPIMAAIAMAESGGCPTATNPTDNNGKQTSWGLWQISDGTHNAPVNWNDPQTNANMAYTKYQSQGLNAWGTYKSGSYQKYISNTPFTSTSNVNSTNAYSSLPFGLGGIIPGLQASFTNFVEETGVFILALGIIILGVILLMSKPISEGIKKAV